MAVPITSQCGTICLGIGSLLLLAALAILLLAWLSPQPIVSSPSETKYVSASSPDKPLPLPGLHDDASVDLTVVIPAFNEVPRLPTMFVTSVTHLEAVKGRTYEFIVVNDGSTDETSDTALSLARRYREHDIRVVTLEKNVGKGGAVRHGMLHGRGRRLLMVDADGASRFEDLELLWEEMDKLLKENEAAISIGSRAHLVNTEVVVKRSFIRNMAMYALHTVLRLVGVGHIRDTQCGFKLFSRKAAQDIFPSQRLSGWIFDVELLLMAKLLNIPVAEVPISWNEVPESKIRLLRDSVMMFKDLLVMRVNYALGRWTVASEKLKGE